MYTFIRNATFTTTHDLVSCGHYFLFRSVNETHTYTPTYLLHFTLKSTTHALALKPKPLVVRSTDRGKDTGLLKKWHCSPRLWHRLPRLSALVTESEVTKQLLPCAVFALSLIPNEKDFLFA